MNNRKKYYPNIQTLSQLKKEQRLLARKIEENRAWLAGGNDILSWTSKIKNIIPFVILGCTLYKKFQAGRS